MSVGTIKWLMPFKQSDYQYFREWATEAWQNAGGAIRRNFNIPWVMRVAVGKLGLARRIWPCKMRKLIVCCTGRPDYYVWPFCYSYEIVPVLWDCWPRYWPMLVKFCQRCRVRTIFCTSSQTAAMLKERLCGINAIWLPEGINAAMYPMGKVLVERKNAVMKFGRDAGGKLLYPTQESFSQGLRDSKIVICRPRCDTNPKHAEGLETLTQRYWECMLSGALMVGRAPRELIDFCGYNPVIEVARENQEAKIGEILAEVAAFQPLADKNREFAAANADWSCRMEMIVRCIS